MSVWNVAASASRRLVLKGHGFSRAVLTAFVRSLGSEGYLPENNCDSSDAI
jgi:hypothetical protein